MMAVVLWHIKLQPTPALTHLQSTQEPVEHLQKIAPVRAVDDDDDDDPKYWGGGDSNRVLLLMSKVTLPYWVEICGRKRRSSLLCSCSFSLITVRDELRGI